MPTVRIYATKAWKFDIMNTEDPSIIGKGYSQEWVEVSRISEVNKGSEWLEQFIKFDFTELNGKVPTSAAPSLQVRQIYDAKGRNFGIQAEIITTDWEDNGNLPKREKLETMGLHSGRITFPPLSIDNGNFFGIFVRAKADRTTTHPSEYYLVVSFYLSQTNIDKKFYCDVTYENPTPYANNHMPAAGFVNEKADNTFSWGITADNIIGTMTQGAAKFRWRTAGENEYTEILIPDTTNSYTVPANTFPADGKNIEWQVQVQSSDGIWSNSTEWLTLTTVDALSDAKPILPKDVYVEVDKDQTFTWEHIIDTGTNPTGADLQYQVNGGAWTDLVSVRNTKEKSVIVSGKTIPAGSVLWRVRTYNSDGTPGNWSGTAAVIGKGTPATPTITSITKTARPRINWQSLGQVSFQVQILQKGDIVYDSHEIAGTAKQHLISEYLEDGEYTLRIRIKNAELLWSNWTTLLFAISTEKPSVPTVAVTAIKNGVRINVEAGGDESITKMYLFRNGIPIAKISGSYADYAALGPTTYTVRAIGKNDSFADSAPVSVTLTVPFTTLAAVDDLQNIVGLIMKRGGRPTHSGTKQIVGDTHHYAGRTLPLFTFSEFTDETFQIAYSYSNDMEWEKLLKLIARKTTILYRDMWGLRCYGVITGLDYDRMQKFKDFTLSIAKVDYVEQIYYEAPEV